MLLDEPFGQLDARTRSSWRRRRRDWETEKRTVLFVTNNIEEAVYLGDRIITLPSKLPGRMHATYEVNLPRPREAEMKFLQLRQQIADTSELVL